MEEEQGENQIKPKVEGGAEDAISIKVKDQNGGEVVFRVKAHTRFEKIMKAFCSKKSVDPNQVRFVFDGQRLESNSTPAECEMEDGDTIDAFLEQVGGAC